MGGRAKSRGCSSFTGCISKGARVRCLRLINSDAARCTFKSPYILGIRVGRVNGWTGALQRSDHVSDRVQGITLKSNDAE